MMQMKISPSILASDFSRLAEEVTAMEGAGAEMIHIDVMDGHFVPNITLGPVVVSSLRKKTEIFFDVHLMISDPLRYAEDFVKAGAQLITFHLEADSDVSATLSYLKKLGVKRALSLKPATPAQLVFPYLKELDMVLVMTVEPGFGGQKFMENMMPKVSEIRAECRRQGIPDLDIQVDGGIDNQTVRQAAQAGANVFVAGSSLFRQTDYANAVAVLRENAQAAVQD